MRLASALFAILLAAAPQGGPRTEKITIPKTTITFEMVLVPGGKGLVGSPKSEPSRGDDESEPREVELKPFWMGKCEVTWEEYELFYMATDIPADALAQPTFPYEPPDRGMGRGQSAAMSISWLACKGYCDWLSWKTGKKYRLPTEEEWEYAARAGSKGASLEPLGDHAWFKENSSVEGKGPQNQVVGQKKPNAFGLHDMLGGVWEYCVGPYSAEDKSPVVRGGSWSDPATEVRFANRQKGLAIWNERDPNRPRSIWWLTDGPFIGFRIVRDLEPGEK